MYIHILKQTNNGVETEHTRKTYTSNHLRDLHLENELLKLRSDINIIPLTKGSVNPQIFFDKTTKGNIIIKATDEKDCK